MAPSQAKIGMIQVGWFHVDGDASKLVSWQDAEASSDEARANFRPAYVIERAMESVPA